MVMCACRNRNVVELEAMEWVSMMDDIRCN